MTDARTAVDRVDPGTPAGTAAALAERFAELTQRPAEGVFAAPGRVNLIGEHTDYNDGLCLPVALPHATYVAAAVRDDGRLRVASTGQDGVFEACLDELGPGHVAGWPAYVAGVVWALRDIGVAVPALDLLVDSRVPVGAGLSSSAALECAVALAACAGAGVEVDEPLRRQLVDVCMRAEREVAGAPTGGMDQTVSMLARAGHALLLDCRDWSTEQIPWGLAGEVEILAVDTRATHALVDGQYAVRRAECEAAAGMLGVPALRDVGDVGAVETLADVRLRKRAWHVVTEIGRVTDAVAAIRTGDLVGLGDLLLASHASLRDDYEVSCPELDLVVEAAMAHGALGARMTGGGFGGSAIALVPSSDLERIELAVDAAFATRGWAAPGFLRVTPSTGAARVTC